MSTRKHFLHRFSKSERARKKDSKDGSKMVLSSPPVSSTQSFDGNLFEGLEQGKESLNAEIMDRDEQPEYQDDSTDEDIGAASFSVEEVMASVTWQSEDEKTAFEEQLTQLQEQMMMVKMENQALHNELSVEVKNDIEQMKADLACERRRCEMLQKDLDSSNNKRKLFRRRKFHRNSSDQPQWLDKSGSTVSLPQLGSSSSLEEQEDTAAYQSSDTNAVEIIAPSVPPRFLDRLLRRVIDTVTEFLEDLTEEDPPELIETLPEDPFSMRKLRENLGRFGAAVTPYMDTVRGMGEVLAWKSPLYTLVVFLVFMYTAWHGWMFPAFVLCLAFRLFVNYLRYAGLKVGFNFFDTAGEKAQEPEERVLGISGRVNVVMSVARRAQNTLGAAADALEKIKSLFTWRHPEASRLLLLAICAVFLVACILPIDHILHYGGLLLGVRLFLINYVYIRFPRLRRRNSDNSTSLWGELPTDIQYEKKYARSEIDKYIRSQSNGEGETHTDVRSEQVSTDDRTFCELFSLPESECPLPGWSGGRRCTLINREKSLTAASKTGKLFLTHSFLCYQRSKSPSPGNIIIPLTDIERLEKAKPHGWIPGSGMAIEIAVVGVDRTFLFGRLLHRDELYYSICETRESKLKEVDLALKDDALPSTGEQKKARKRQSSSPKDIQPFSFADTYEFSD